MEEEEEGVGVGYPSKNLGSRHNVLASKGFGKGVFMQGKEAVLYCRLAGLSVWVFSF